MLAKSTLNLKFNIILKNLATEITKLSVNFFLN